MPVLDDWRTLLYYPLGILPSLFFSLRFLIQWIRSEKLQQSTIMPLFWKLSLVGNTLLCTHYFIQLQYPFALIQALNGLIAWRNLNLMQTEHPPTSLKKTICLMLACLAAITGLYALQLTWLGQDKWVGAAAAAHAKKALILPLWLHIAGIGGQLLFASRFWIQWWLAEKQHRSELTAAFWWISLAGTMLSLTYFIAIQDPVSILHNSFGMIPYFRNLVLIRRTKEAKSE